MFRAVNACRQLQVGEGNFTDFCTELQGSRERSCAWLKAPVGGQHRQLEWAEDHSAPMEIWRDGGWEKYAVLQETRGRLHSNPMGNCEKW